MSEERLRFILQLDTVGLPVMTDGRQQITPDMRFTCDGMITKWIIGADWDGYSDYSPELQLWRSNETGVYHKISGTHLSAYSQSQMQVYEYEQVYEYANFPPIPVKAGDVLGVFIPPDGQSKLRLRAEGETDPVNYYIPTGSATESPYNSVNILDAQLVSSATYHPLVTVEMIRSK